MNHSKFPGRIRKLWVVRHGQSEWNKTHRVSGQADPALSEEGRAMADRLARVLRSERIDAIVCSTLQRTIETASPVAGDRGVTIRQEADFREQGLGIAEGRYRDERDPEVAALWRERDNNRVDYRIAGGETFAEVYARVARLMTKTVSMRCGEQALLVGHRNSVRAALGYLLGWSLEASASARVRTKFLYEFDLAGPVSVRSILLRPDRLGDAREGLVL
jgi:broad specificity phosphatase PhoE